MSSPSNLLALESPVDLAGCLMAPRRCLHLRVILPAPVRILNLRLDADLAGYFNRHRRSRKALPMTTRSDKPIASAQRTGLMKPNAARGIPAAL